VSEARSAFIEGKKMNIYVGNLSYDVQENDLREAFSSFGKVVSAKVIGDMYTGKSKGFGFVEMETKQDGEAAIGGLNGTEFRGRTITVNEARPRTEGGGGGGGGGPRGGGNGRGPGRGGSGGGGGGGFGGGGGGGRRNRDW
jgi:RNA recognition motif-containing protein